MGEQTRSQQLNRRDFLKLSGVSGVSLFLTACGISPDRVGIRENLLIPETNPLLELGNEEAVNIAGLQEYPDGQISLLKAGDNSKLWIPGSTQSYLVEGGVAMNLVNPVLAIGPDRAMNEHGFQGYRALTSVIPRRVAGELFGFYHEENWQSSDKPFPFQARIGMALSNDNGSTWQLVGPIIEGQTRKKPSEGVSGAGQPTAIIIGSEILLYFTDWNGKGSDAIHVAKAPFANADNPDVWTKFDGKGFRTRGLGGVSSAVIIPQNQDQLYAALPMVSMNKTLGKLIMVYETNIGFMVATSQDGGSWESHLIARFPTPQVKTQTGDRWYSYPSLLSDSPTQTVLVDNGWLYYSSGIRGGELHHLVRRPFNLKR